MTTTVLRPGSEVFVLTMRPEPLMHLVGCGGPLPWKVCRATIKAIAAGGEHFAIDDSEVAPALGKDVVGQFVVPFTGLVIERGRAVHLGCDELVTVLTGPLGRVVADYPDLGRSLRRRWASFTEGEILLAEDFARGQEVGLC